MATGRTSLPLSRRSFAASIAVTPLLAGFSLKNVSTHGRASAPMSREETQEILDAYLTALLAGGDFGQYLAEDFVVRFMDVGQEVSGRQACVDGITALHSVQFGARPELVNQVVREGVAATEALFVGKHTGEFAGIPATGRTVRVPYVVFSAFAGGR